jgi:PPM family protein phosphatase
VALSPTVLAALRFGIASVFFLFPLARAVRWGQVTHADLVRMVVLGQTAYGQYFWLQYAGVQRTSKEHAAVSRRAREHRRSPAQMPRPESQEERSTPRKRRAAAPGAWTLAKCSVASDEHADRNEDAAIADPGRGLAAVFDGVGGSVGGAIAAQVARRVVHRGWKRLVPQADGGRKGQVVIQEGCAADLPATLARLLESAHTQVRAAGARRAHSRSSAPPGVAGMPATTAAVAAICRRARARRYTLAYAHVGDSRVYLVPAEAPIQRLTRDDGLLSKLVTDHVLDATSALRIDQATERGQLSAVELALFQRRNGITQALGDTLPPAIHAGQTMIGPGDLVVICTDGVHDNLTDREIEAIVRGAAPTSAARALIQHAQQRSRHESDAALRAKPDDMSAVVITCHPRQRARERHGRAQSNPLQSVR